jgi:LacI family transcriptional regulator
VKGPAVVLRIDTSESYGRGIIRGISKYSREFGRWYINQNLTYFDSSGHSFDTDRPQNWIADGIITDSYQFPEMLKQLRIPIIAFDCYQDFHDIPKIEADGQAIAEMALKHFMDRNFSNLAYCGFEGMYWVVYRGECFAQCAGARGIDVATYEVTTPEDGLLWEDALVKMGIWLKSLPHPLGLLTCNDDCAKLAIYACRLADIAVPDDVAILGMNNDEMVCLPINPPLSSVALDFERAGFEAAALLDKLMKGQEKSANQRIDVKPTHVKIRRSTDTFAVDDPVVKLALKYIRDHSHKVINVPDVVERASLSRRSLEYRFKKFLGRPINKVIRDQRMAKITDMLVETNLPISRIALRLGFTSTEHISRFFGKAKGISPSEFRNQRRKV